VANHRLKLTDRLSLWPERPQLNLSVRRTQSKWKKYDKGDWEKANID